MAPAVRDRFGQLLKDARERADLSQEDIGQELGVDRSLVSQWERGDRKSPVSNEHVNRLSRLIRVPVLDLVLALGYDVRVPGIENEQQATVLRLYQEALPEVQRAILGALRGAQRQQLSEGL